MERRREGEPEPVEAAGTRERVEVREAEAEEPGFIGTHLAIVLRVATGIGVALLLVGTVLVAITQGRLPTTTVPLGMLPGLLVKLNPNAILTLGIVLFVAAPALGLAYLAQAFLRTSDRLYALIAAAVLLILISSMLITLGLRGL